MPAQQTDPYVRLFYSYSHRDSQYRTSMEKSLTVLQHNGLLQQWSDQQIVPGQHISAKVRETMDQANVMVFIFSPGFIASKECRKEWEYATTLASSGRLLFRIPIIVRECAWKDMLGSDDVKVLPNDGNPVTHFEDEDTTWHEVYQGIKAVIDEISVTFTPKEDFLGTIDKSDFLSQDHLKLRDLYVFSRMTCEDPPQTSDHTIQTTTIASEDELLAYKRTLIHGQEKIGKTALARHLCLSLIEKSQPVLFVDLAQSTARLDDTFLRDTYRAQFHGDYLLWLQRPNKTLILDNLTAAARSLEFVVRVKDIFDRIIVTVSSDVFYSFFQDEARLADFRQFRMEPLSRSQQEHLIRKRLAMSDVRRPITDGLVDQIEGHINSIIISDKIVPRFPFYVLSILQTYEAYMPTDMSITSYGHCYYVLIVANLIRSGISKTDDDVNACFNFAEHLAFEVYRHRRQLSQSPFDFTGFLTKYKDRFFIKESIVNRLRHRSYGFVHEDGTFRTEYMYYYFLGKFLAGNISEGRAVISAMCEDSYKEANYLTLLFTIHHSRDKGIIDDILIRTMCTLDSVRPAILDRDETRRFRDIVTELPESILSTDSVEEARRKERESQDKLDGGLDMAPEGVAEPEDASPVNEMYRILKNNKIMGQVLRNKHGNLEKTTIEETVEIIADGGLRLIKLFLRDEKEIAKWALFIKGKHPDWDLPRIKYALQYVSFMWTMINIEQIVDAVDVPEISEAVNAVVRRIATPAYDLIGYFSQLDRAKELTTAERDSLKALLRKHDDVFVQRVLSIRTQHYMNTHRGRVPVAQSMHSLLKLKYQPRVLQ